MTTMGSQPKKPLAIGQEVLIRGVVAGEGQRGVAVKIEAGMVLDIRLDEIERRSRDDHGVKLKLDGEPFDAWLLGEKVRVRWEVGLDADGNRMRRLVGVWERVDG